NVFSFNLYLPDKGNITFQENDLGIVTDHFNNIHIDVRRSRVTVEAAVPSIRCCIGREVPSLEYHLSPAIEHAHGLDIIEVASPWVEDIVHSVVIRGKGIRYKIVFTVTNG